MQVKICGLSTPESVEATVAAGATFIGFVFFPNPQGTLLFRKRPSWRRFRLKVLPKLP